jgi:hypothetical protein
MSSIRRVVSRVHEALASDMHGRWSADVLISEGERVEEKTLRGYRTAEEACQAVATLRGRRPRARVQWSIRKE